MNAPFKQHLIDPEICIRCYTCEEHCPIGAITHDDNNVVVDHEQCNFCMDCIAPCPTGSIDNWRVVTTAYSVEEQLEWMELPDQEELADADSADEAASMQALEDEIAALLAKAHEGTGGKPEAPASAAKPSVNLYNRSRPARAVVQGNYRLTDPDADNDVRHIILSFGDQMFPVLEGQSIGILVPGEDENGKPHEPRLYSVASARDGERRNTNNLALTVKREPNGLASNYICDLERGAEVDVVGPFGATFLLPEDPEANVVMICTGTGSAPFRAFTERRRRAMPDVGGKLHLYFGARRPEELPYFGPLKKVPESLLHQELCFSRVEGQPKEYVQDRLRKRADSIAGLLRDDKTHIYICGLKGMETGVDESLADICRQSDLDWSEIKPQMRTSGRYHVETY
jgi:benzoyl-CoA 2,3-dioxygenase component A